MTIYPVCCHLQCLELYEDCTSPPTDDFVDVNINNSKNKLSHISQGKEMIAYNGYPDESTNQVRASVLCWLQKSSTSSFCPLHSRKESILGMVDRFLFFILSFLYGCLDHAIHQNRICPWYAIFICIHVTHEQHWNIYIIVWYYSDIPQPTTFHYFLHNFGNNDISVICRNW